MIDVETRLQRAINLNDVLLVRRIIKNNPSFIRHPDFDDHNNTPLHLAAKLGHFEIVDFLVKAGHEDEGISLNTNYETPLAVSIDAKHLGVALYLARAFPRCIPWTNLKLQDPLMLAARAGLLPLLPVLLTGPHPASPALQDMDGNSALHHASAQGELKAVRVLLQFGADPLLPNTYSWTPIAFSSTPAAEAYFHQLAGEIEKRRGQYAKIAASAAASASGQPPPPLEAPLNPQTPEEHRAAHRAREEAKGRERAGSALSAGAVTAASARALQQQQQAGRTVRIVTDVDDGPRAASAAGFFAEPGRGEWSPVTALNERRVMTPVESTVRQPGAEGARTGFGRRRAESGE